MHRSTRREALVTLAAGVAAGPLAAQTGRKLLTFSESEYELLSVLADMILPPTDTPGAREAGVPAILDEDLAEDGERLQTLRTGLADLQERGFRDWPEEGRLELLTRFSEASGEERDFFETLKELTVDAYYSTEAGLVQELGYRGNTYLADFPGCTHDHQIDGDA